MSRYSLFFESIRHNPSNPHIDADTLKWLPLMYIIVCTVQASDRMTSLIQRICSWQSRLCLHRKRWQVDLLGRSRGVAGFMVVLVGIAIPECVVIFAYRHLIGSALTCAKALQRDNLDIVYASLLTARYMSVPNFSVTSLESTYSVSHCRFLTRRAAEGSTPLTSAFQLGLYRDGSVLNLTDKREIELRRRAWAMVYHLDRSVYKNRDLGIV